MVGRFAVHGQGGAGSAGRIKRLTPFSARSDWRTQLNRLSECLVQKRRQGATVLDLTESNPTRCHFRFFSSGLLKPFVDPKNLVYEPDPRGSLGACRAICRYYAQKDIEVSPDQLFLTAGTSEAIHWLFRLLVEPGQAVACAAPSYPLLDTLAGLDDVVLQKYALKYANGWGIDPDSLQNSSGAELRAVVAVHPNNPTGQYISPWERQRLNEFCRHTGCALIVDEVFLDYAREPENEPESFASNSEVLTFTLSGISKVLGLPQMKLSWIVVSGPAVLRREAMERLEVIADAYLSVNTPAQNALPVWLSAQKTVCSQILARVRANAAALADHVQKAGVARMLPSEGGWFAVLRMNGRSDDEEAALRLLQEKNVLVHPGYLFDFESGEYLVLSLLPEEKRFKEAIRRLCEGL